ncbi:hypothetical protein GXW83_25135 [Streptacidiphilus sp. PB12-B1b]|uniref:streptophobe family protein n=1 Tax=Streptacidiphilus sp. PB12-B1b TaxID=2705012 RepID=UPI0015F99FD4|nr:streptophobe family protein [Streptacidiphilus sp. PB12-B1b]QMU78503.1 hypothetical protein GXW83_25135 [Streptacidiphilus sp. PB12-B1b]
MGRPRGLLVGAVLAATTASWAFAAMGAVAALGVHLLGLDRYAAIGPATAALVAMATGGTVSPSGDLSVFGLQAAGAQGAIGVVPLGVSFVGAVVFGTLFVRPLRRLPVLDLPVLLSRLAGALVGFLLLLWVVAWSGNGTVAINLDSVTGGGSGSSGGSGPLGSLGGLGGLIGGVVGGSTKPTVGFTVDLLPTLGLGLLWALAVLALALIASRRVPLPHGWTVLRRDVRPAVSAVVTVVCGAVLAGAVSGLVVGLTGNGGAKTVGGVLLGTPNGVFLALPLGMAVPLNGKASGPLAQFLPAPVNQLLKGGGGQSITLSRLAGMDGRVWLLPVAVALMLLAAGVLAAVRTPRPAAPRGALREAAEAGLRLGVVLAVTVPVLLGLAEVSVNADVSVFGFSAIGAGLSISGNLAAGAGLGLLEGAVLGFLGALLVRRFADAQRRPATPAEPAAPAGPAGPAAAPPLAHPYDALPGRPQPPQRPGPSGNPYAAPPGPPVNPYSGGPAQQPPPPPTPPGH